jgi:prepilin-type N-terminal cleavage/methylation domain-containing protein
MKLKIKGFTLVELLISLALLGIVMVTLFQTMGGTIQASNSTNASNDLLREGQIAQQILTARFREACYVFPAGATLSLAASGYSTKNAFGSPDTDWNINTHPIVAMVLPPDPNDPTPEFRFIAYYAIPRSQYTVPSPLGAAPSNNPGQDAANDSTTWMIMEYRKNLGFPPGTTTPCSAMPTSINIKGQSGKLLLDYVQIASPITSLFSVGGTGPDGGAAWIQYDLRLQKDTRSGNIVRVGGTGTNSNLSGRVFPINLGL